MSKVNINKSKLKNSPVIVDSLNTKNKKDHRFLSKPNIKNITLKVIAGLIVGIILLFLSPFLISLFNNQDMKEEDKDPKVNIEESQLEKSPVIVDSPDTTVNYIDTPIPSINIKTGELTNLGIDNKGNKYQIKYSYEIKTESFTKKFDYQDLVFKLFDENDDIIGDFSITDNWVPGKWKGMSLTSDSTIIFGTEKLFNSFKFQLILKVEDQLVESNIFETS